MSKINLTFKGKSYSIDKSLLAGAIASLEAHFGNIGTSTPVNPSPEGRLEGDGGEYYTLAPTALSFRSTEPLNEFQEVKVNGEVVDPSNYTLEEGSTIVTLSIDYLKTLPVGSYSIEVVSANNAPSGDFIVAAPELNEHGFYYNQPYVGYVQSYGNVALFYRENGVLDFIITDTDYIETATYTVSGNTLTNNVSLGAIPATISNGDEIQCAALGATFKLGDTSITADADYMYVYKEDLGGYEVTAIDKTKAKYGAIKTGINGVDTVKLADYMFENNVNLVNAPKIPDSVTDIGNDTFNGCRSLTRVAIPNGVTKIGEASFKNCTSLMSIMIPDSVTEIYSYAFCGCINLNTIKMSDNITYIGNYAFEHCAITSIEIPKCVTYIAPYIFHICRKLTNVTIHDGVTVIGSNAFDDCTKLASIVIPDSVTSMGENVFEDCSSLMSVVFDGTKEQWGNLHVHAGSGVPATYVQCSDGQVYLV